MGAIPSRRILGLPPWMRLFVDLFEAIEADLGVNLRRANVFVSE